MKARTLTVWMTGLLLSASFTSNAQNVPVATGRYTPDWDNRKHSKKCTFYTLRFGCSFAAVNTIKPQLL